jgi:hypothetical protein
MHSERDFGAAIAARLNAGSRDDYELVQHLVVRAQKTQNWVYGDMLMQIVWSLLPTDAQDEIAARRPSLVGEGALAPEARLCAIMRQQLGQDIFAAWFQNVRLKTIEATTVTVSVPIKFLANWIKSHYRDELLRCCQMAFPGTERVVIELRRPGTLH